MQRRQLPVESVHLDEADRGEGGGEREQVGHRFGRPLANPRVESAEGQQKDQKGQRRLGVERPAFGEIDQRHPEPGEAGCGDDQSGLGRSGHGR